MFRSSAPAGCLAAIFLLSLLLGGCSEYPRDPRDTSETATGGVIRVGIAENPPWTLAGDQAGGVEAELVEAFARTLGAEVEWHRGSESDLLERLQHFELDIVVAGLTARTPWKSRVATTIPYLDADTDGDGKKEKHIMAVPPGENGWLIRLDRFLHTNQSDALLALWNRGTADDAGEPRSGAREASAGGLDP